MAIQIADRKNLSIQAKVDAYGSMFFVIADSSGNPITSANPINVTMAGSTPNTENKRGSNCSGSDGNSNRILILSNTATSTNEMIVLNGQVLTLTEDYTMVHNTVSSTITFIANIDDTDYISVRYYT